MVLFCIVFGLDKNLTLTKSNKFVFVSLNRFFTLSLQKIIIISMHELTLRDITVDNILLQYNGAHIGNDIVLVDDFKRLPMTNDTGRMQCLLMAVCLKGTARYTVDTT